MRGGISQLARCSEAAESPAAHVLGSRARPTPTTIGSSARKCPLSSSVAPQDRSSLLRRGKRMTPAQTGETREIAIGRDQFAAVLDRKGGDIRIGDERPLDAAAQLDENVPMTAARRDERRPGPVHKTLAE